MGVGAGLYMYVVVVQKFTFAISSPGEFLLRLSDWIPASHEWRAVSPDIQTFYTKVKSPRKYFTKK